MKLLIDCKFAGDRWLPILNDKELLYEIPWELHFKNAISNNNFDSILLGSLEGFQRYFSAYDLM